MPTMPALPILEPLRALRAWMSALLVVLSLALAAPFAHAGNGLATGLATELATGLATGLANSAAPLLLDDRAATVEAWPAVTLLRDPDARLDIADVSGALERFAKPDGAYATLGMTKDVVWLRIPVQAASGGDGAWMLQADFGLLNRVDLYVIRAGRVERHAQGGALFGARAGALGGPVPAFVLHLQPGTRYDVLLRVETNGPKILPITLRKGDAFYQQALEERLVQGMLTGLTLCLLLYSLAQWVNLRESLFGKYALLIGGLSLYNVAWWGMGAQYLWGGSPWAIVHATGIISLMTACGGYLFVGAALTRPGVDRIFPRLMQGGAPTNR